MQLETIDEFLAFMDKTDPDLLSKLMEQAATQAWLDLNKQANIEQVIFGLNDFSWEDYSLEWEVNAPLRSKVPNRF